MKNVVSNLFLFSSDFLGAFCHWGNLPSSKILRLLIPISSCLKIFFLFHCMAWPKKLWGQMIQHLFLAIFQTFSWNSWNSTNPHLTRVLVPTSTYSTYCKEQLFFCKIHYAGCSSLKRLCHKIFYFWVFLIKQLHLCPCLIYGWFDSNSPRNSTFKSLIFFS
jgi:hypothetical protein